MSMPTRDSATRLSARPEHKVTEVFATLREIVEGVRNVCEVLIKPAAGIADFADDVRKIDRACDRFDDMGRRERDSLIVLLEARSLDREELSRVRHDLRAQVGAMKGYGELIYEEITEDGLGTDATVVLLAGLVERSTEALPVIDQLRFEDLVVDDATPTPADGTFILQVGDGDVQYEPRFQDRLVLVIDDSDYNREILGRRLERAGLRTLMATNGLEGVERALSDEVDLILCDIMMPGLNGYETLQRLKNDARTQDIPVLMISAISEVRSIVRCIEEGAEDYLSTPFNPTILHARIKACLDKKILRDRDRRHLDQLTEARAELEMAIESMDDGFAVYDGERRLSMCNQQFRDLYPGVEALGGTGFTLTELLEDSFGRGLYFFERRFGGGAVIAENFDDWSRLRLTRYDTGEPNLERMAGGRWIEIVHSPTPSGGFVAVHKDVTQRKQDEERLTFLALHDPLTGLVNRAFFETHLQETFAKAQSSGGRFALMYLDLDGFKQVNDTLGHDVGDALLISVSEKLLANVRDRDVVARLGGDEFAVVLATAEDAAMVGNAAQRILDAVGTRFESEGKSIDFGVSIGIAIYPDDATEQELFLKRADAAMYSAKKGGKGRSCFWADVPAQ